MAYRNGVYAAFDGQGKVNPTESDIRYFQLLKAWAEAKGEDFQYINSHDKTRAVRDSSKKETLQRVLRERLSKSKVMFIILSNETSYDRGFLNYEIEKALDLYKLPLIIAYPQISDRSINDQWATLEKRWPKALKQRLKDPKRDDLSCLHIHFKKELIKRSLNHMTVHDKKYIGARLCYEN
ncbi:TIR domain-containing protein [Halalkalibacter alkalisediminis]|uniref:TIR domain-containing protein n=1 Tax=Halalkalibacter alkalisediminis TaxID=935616 RepID=A0ABV6NE45_9BACI|nr:TIR domain-containing protein [Halalkalibacter alkalisediminis]